MSDRSDLAKDVGGRAEGPLHYTACGLDDVYLLDGYAIADTPYGRGVTIRNLDGLHDAIAANIVLRHQPIAARELRFLRKQMEMTQEEFAAALGVSAQSVARYEKGQTEIPGPVDRLARVLHALHRGPAGGREHLVEDILARRRRDDADRPDATFRSVGDEWRAARAA